MGARAALPATNNSKDEPWRAGLPALPVLAYLAAGGAGENQRNEIPSVETLPDQTAM